MMRPSDSSRRSAHTVLDRSRPLQDGLCMTEVGELCGRLHRPHNAVTSAYASGASIGVKELARTQTTLWLWRAPVVWTQEIQAYQEPSRSCRPSTQPVAGNHGGLTPTSAVSKSCSIRPGAVSRSWSGMAPDSDSPSLRLAAPSVRARAAPVRDRRVGRKFGWRLARVRQIRHGHGAACSRATRAPRPPRHRARRPRGDR